MSEQKSTGIGWERPSPSRHGYDWTSIAAQLKTRPGEWLKIFEDGPVSVVNGIRNNNVKAIRPADGFEVTTRNNRMKSEDNPVKTCDLYLRWNGKEK